MSESAQTFLERFQLVKVPSLPHLFLGMDAAREAAQEDQGQLPHPLEDDPFLCLRVLASGARPHGEDGSDMLSGGIPPAHLQALVSSSALQTGFADPGDLLLNFYKGYWRQAVLCSALMRELARRCRYPREDQAALCGLLLDCGELVLENVLAGRYLDLQRQACTEQDLLRLECENFGTTHAELGADLLAGWNVERTLTEAVRYHHEEADVMGEAGKLARLAWLASATAAGDTPRAQLDEQAGRLLQLDAADFDSAVTRARAALEAKERGLRIRAGTRRLPLAHSRAEDVAAEDEVARLRLRQRLLGVSLFNAVRPAAGDCGEGTEGLATWLSLLFGLRAFALFRHDPAARCLRVAAGQPSLADLGELDILTDASTARRQSTVLAAFHAQERRILEADREDLATHSVLDRQLLTLLGTRRLLCEPLPGEGSPAGVLVIGYNSGEIDYYLDQTLLASLFRQAAAGLLAPAGARGDASAELLHQHAVREVIHEVNNPLGIIKNYLQLLAMQQQDRPQVMEEIAVLKAEIDRVVTILNKLRHDGAAEEMSRVDLNAVVEKLAKVFNSSVIRERQLQLVLDLDPALPPLRSNENALKQVITNLVVNAAEALPAQGRITIATRAHVFSEGRRCVEMTVADDGPGIAPEVMERLFAHANTTKGGHAGEGLAIVKTLSDSLEGRLSCRTGRKGTEFILLLPLPPGGAVS